MPTEGVTIPVPLRSGDDRRRAERFAAAMPVSVDGCEGTTQDLSTSGLSFLSDRAYEPGARVEVVIEYLLDGHRYPLRCEAEVVRVESVGERFAIGARLVPQPQVQPVAVAPAESVAPERRLRSVD